MQKDFSLSSTRANPKNWDSIVKELKKCILLCSNCHKEHHYPEMDRNNVLRILGLLTHDG